MTRAHSPNAHMCALGSLRTREYKEQAAGNAAWKEECVLEMDRNRVEMLRKRYPKGTRLCLDHMEGEPQMPSGLKGEVFYVDDAGQIHVQWENGSTLALTEVDSFHKEAAPEKTKKRGEVSR